MPFKLNLSKLFSRWESEGKPEHLELDEFLEPDADASEAEGGDATSAEDRKVIAAAAGTLKPDPRDAKLAELESQLKAEREERLREKIDTAASAFVAGLDTAATPPMGKTLAALHARLARDAAGISPAADEPTPAALLAQLGKELPRHILGPVGSGQSLPPNATALPNQTGQKSDDPASVSPERRRQLLSYTEEGRAILRREAQAARANGAAHGAR